ncbi:M23 family metallopeptidase [Shinella sp. DD12]|uniref:M23 family metallopeptidase n=1 Tax=Shinella sp. DD12 TaxID=1410620 RepID=UPI0003C565C3|nr:M23 family metallopeptidase [Shinella sp. DD12]EYR84247.1 metalloendopeptidase [Shinella sp. DD12]
MAKVSTVIDTILAEAGGSTPSERLADMKAIASVMLNRAVQLGKPLKDIISVPSEFNAFGKAFPPGVEKYRALAEQALKDVEENGPVHSATFYATPKAAHRLPDGLQPETETAGHQFFSDPEMRSIRTAQGFVRPDAGGAMLASYAPDERTSAEPSAFDALFGGYSANPQQGFTDQSAVSRQPGLLTQGAIAKDGLLGVEREGYGSPFGLMGDRITSGFGGRAGPMTPMGVGSTDHKGIDLSLQANTEGYPVEASAGGVVTYAGPRRGYGNMVEIQHPDGMTTRYGHLQEVGNLAIGDKIARGTPVGMLGNTGRSRGPHLHFETVDAQDNWVDPRTVVGFNSEVRVPTPEARPEEAWQSAAPIAVERQSLPDVDMGVTGRMASGADIAQGRDGLRDAMLGDSGVRRATETEMSAMQDEANRSRQAMEARMRGGISLTPDQQATFAARRESALGLLNQRMTPTQMKVSTPGQTGAMSGEAMTAELTNPADYGAVAAHTLSTTGLSPTMTQSVSVTDMNPNIRDLSAPLSLNEYTGLLSNPGLVGAKKYGMTPNSVKTVDVDLLSQPKTAGMGIVEGPVSAGIDTQPEAATTQQAAATGIPSRIGAKARNFGATFLGGMAGGALGGPIGSLLGAKLARDAFGVPNAQQGLLSKEIDQRGLLGGLLNTVTGGRADPWSGVGTLNNIGSGAQAAYGAWGGPKGTSAIATDGSRITSLGGGLVSRIDRNGIETLFRDGQSVGGGGGTGGLLGGLFGGNTGDGSRSQADKARDSVGLY